MRYASALLAMSLSATTLPGPAAAQELPIDRIRQIAQSGLAEVPGLAVAIGQGGEVTWTEGFGRAALEPERPATAASRFRVYSVSKPWTAAAALRLAAAGRLDPEAPIRVQGFPDKGVPVTAFQLGTHTAGIRHYREGEAETDRRCETVADALAFFAGDPLLFEPGTDESYSTWGYVLLAAVIEQAAGSSFDRALRAEVLGPAGMEATVHAAAEAPAAARPYEREAGGYRDVGDTTDPSCKWGGGGYLATVADLARFPLAALGGGLLSPPAVALLFDPAEGPIRHTGGSGPGGTALVRTDAGTGLVVAVAANTGGALEALRDVADRIAAVIAADPER